LIAGYTRSVHVSYVCAECGSCYDRAGYCAREGKPLALAEDPLLGREVGRYRVARMLAEGGMGRVYLGVQPAIGSRVAIKILSDAARTDLLERFFAEAKAVNMIRHENIVSVIDLAKLDDGRPYIVMEYIEGQTLGALVRAGGAPLGGVIQVMLEVLSALAAAHAIGIVHRDLKPDNVLVTGEGHAKVLDFGIAKLMPGVSQLSPRTQTGALLGTPAYMAPEQISGSGQIDARTDIYAAGVVLYEAVTGRVPFVGETLFDLMRLHLEAPPPSPRALRPDMPLSLEQVILQALAKSPEARFQTAAAMAQAVKHASTELGAEQWRSLSSRNAIITGGRQAVTSAAPTPQLTEPTPRPRSNALWIIAVLAAALAAVLVTLVVVRKSDSKQMPDAAQIAESPVADAPVLAEVPPDAPDIIAALDAGNSVVIKRGGGVTIVQKPPQKQLGGTVDYNPKAFDALAYLPKATALAQKIYPDAKLTRFDMVPVRSNGLVDFTMKDAEGSYWFRSALHSKRPADLPPNVPVDRPCMIYVELDARSVQARVVENDECDDKLVRAPRCKLESVWKQALAKGVPADHVAKISWLFDEKWFFDTDLGGSGEGETSTYEDHCSMPPP
jgi:serine/threonine-protein kinase